MRVIYAGTPEFAAQALAALIAAGHEIVLVLTQPDRPAGRGMALAASPVKQLALTHELPVFQPQTLRDPLAQARLAETDADVMVVAAYGLILPQTVLDLPRLGCLNIHASLLPRWRGAAPIQRAIQAGDDETGVCIMQMEAGLDTGPVLMRQALPIGKDDTASSLHDKLAQLGARLIVETLAALPLPALTQPVEGVTYAHKIEKKEAVIDWSLPAEAVDRHIRAFTPFPGAQTSLNGLVIKVWRGTPLGDVASAAPLPGTIVAVDREAITVSCGQGAVKITELQKAGGKRLPVREFLAGTPLSAGQRFTLVE